MIKKVGVVGAGMMGAEIALCFARAGMETVLSDTSLEIAEKGKAKQNDILEKRIKKGKLEKSEKEKILANVVPTGDVKDMADCDIVIEAVLENIEIKLGIFSQLDGICKPETILASNTSSISISKIASAVGDSR